MAENTLLEKVLSLQDKYRKLEESLADPAVIADMKKFVQLNKDYKELQPIIQAGLEYKRMLDELAQAKDACAEDDPKHMQEEFGDLLFAVINASRLYGIDPEAALSGACDKFRRRFSYMEEETLRRGLKLADMTLAEMDTIWDEGKAQGL